MKNECTHINRRMFKSFEGNFIKTMIFLDLNRSKVDERVFQHLIRSVKSDSIKGRFLRSASENGNFDAVRLLLDKKTPETLLTIYCA